MNYTEAWIHGYVSYSSILTFFYTRLYTIYGEGNFGYNAKESGWFVASFNGNPSQSLTSFIKEVCDNRGYAVYQWTVTEQLWLGLVPTEGSVITWTETGWHWT